MKLSLKYCLTVVLIYFSLQEATQANLPINSSAEKTPNQILGDGYKSQFFGSNISSTTSTLHHNEATVGFQITGYGINDRFFIGTSPWMALDYKLYHLAGRYRFIETASVSQSLTVQYFKSADEGCRREGQKYLSYNAQTDALEENTSCSLYHYKQENLWTTWTAQQDLSDRVTLHFNQHINYYWDQTRPFSMRRPSNDKTPWQLISARMAKVDLENDFFIASEIGLLDWEKNPIHLHSSFMIGALKEAFSFHVGLSMTSTPTAYFAKNRKDYQQELRTSPTGFNGNLDENKITNDFSFHPEVAVQIYF